MADCATGGHREWLIDAPFWACLLGWALVPATVTPWIEAYGIPLSIKDISIYILLMYYVTIRFISKATMDCRPALGIPGAVAFLGAFALVSISWTTTASKDKVAMAYTITTTLACFFLSYSVVIGKSRPDVTLLLDRTVFLVSMTCLIYFAESFFGVGLQVRGDGTNQADDFGIQRLRGPLFGAANGYFLIVPSLGYCIDKIMLNRKDIKYLFMSFILLCSVLAMGSRGALVCMGIFGFTFLLVQKGLAVRVVEILVLGGAVTLATILVFSRANTDRISNFEDSSRSDTYEISLRIVEENGIGSIVGTGYGGVWAWYLPDVEEGGARATNRFFILTRFGYMLYHPHSVFLMLCVELGIVGLVFFLKLLQLPVVALVLSMKSKINLSFSCAILSSEVCLFMDFPIFKTWQMSLLWWILILGCLVQLDAHRSRARSGQATVLGYRAVEVTA